MLFSTSNAILLAALACNVASTFGAPIPRRENNKSIRSLRDGSENDTRFLDILVPKKRFRQWNQSRRAARESALKAIRHAEVRLAALAEVEESIGDGNSFPYFASDFWDRELEDGDERRERLSGSHHIGRRSDDDGNVDAAAKELGKLFEKVLSDMHTCPCVSQCPTDPGTPQSCGPGAAPCPGQPGSGDPGTGDSGTGAGTPTNSTDTGLPVTQPDVPPISGTDSQPPMTDSAAVMPTDVPEGGNDDNSAISDATPSPTDSATDPGVTGMSDSGNSTSSSDGGDDPALSTTDTSADPSATGSSEGDEGATGGGEEDEDSGESNTSQTRRSLFERWLGGRTSPVHRAPAGRVNSARFRLT